MSPTETQGLLIADTLAYPTHLILHSLRNYPIPEYGDTICDYPDCVASDSLLW